MSETILFSVANSVASVRFLVDSSAEVWPKAGALVVRVHHPTHEIRHGQRHYYQREDVDGIARYLESRVRPDADAREQLKEFEPLTSAYAIAINRSFDADLFEVHFSYHTDFDEWGPGRPASTVSDPQESALRMRVGFVVAKREIEEAILTVRRFAVDRNPDET